MLKLAFCCLLGANMLLFALGQGYLGAWRGSEHEPARLMHQQNGDQLILISPARARARSAAAQADAAAATKLAAQAAMTIACTEIGNFTGADAVRFEARLAPLALGARLSRRNVGGQEISSYMVFIPPQGSKEGADKKAGELKQMGVNNYFIMSDYGALRWAISLGVFRLEAGAKSLLATLIGQGVHSARVAPRMAGSKLAFQLRELDAPAKASLERIAAAFPSQEMRACK